jgi:hypothetical protein
MQIHLFSRQGRVPAAVAAAPPGLFTSDTPPTSTTTASSTSSSNSTLHGWLLHSGVSVSLHSADLSFSSDVHAAMFGSYGSSSSSFSKGHAGFDMVFHAAGILQDSLIGNQTQASIRAVVAPKAAANIMAATSMMPLQQLVLFSSVASTVGAAGQGNYVAANAVLDGWALAGRRQGTAVSSIQWGAWASAGESSCMYHPAQTVQLCSMLLCIVWCAGQLLCAGQYHAGQRNRSQLTRGQTCTLSCGFAYALASGFP